MSELTTRGCRLVRAAPGPTRWWGKAWVRAVEESAYAERDLGDARTLARSGQVGQLSTGAGHFGASVEDDRGGGT